MEITKDDILYAFEQEVFDVLFETIFEKYEYNDIAIVQDKILNPIYYKLMEQLNHPMNQIYDINLNIYKYEKNEFNDNVIEPISKRLYIIVAPLYNNIINGKFDDSDFNCLYRAFINMRNNIENLYNTKIYCSENLIPFSWHWYPFNVTDYVMCGSNIFNQKYIKEKVNELTYNDFLKTTYWKGIKEYKLNKANHKCALCNSKKNLNVHHKTYERHGLEHLYEVADEDLIVLCKDCHAKFHDKLKTN